MSGGYTAFIRVLTLGGLGFLSYEIYDAYRQEKKIKKLHAMRQYQISSGQGVSQEVEEEIDKYMNEHYGQKVLERLSTRNVLEDQIQLQISTKKDLIQKFKNVSGQEDKIKKIEEDIKRLETLYGQVKSQKAPEFEDYTGAK